MNQSLQKKVIGLGVYFVLIFISLVWIEPLMLIVFLITLLYIYTSLSKYLALRQRHYQQNKNGDMEEFTESQKWDEHVAKASFRRTRGV